MPGGQKDARGVTSAGGFICHSVFQQSDSLLPASVGLAAAVPVDCTKLRHNPDLREERYCFSP